MPCPPDRTAGKPCSGTQSSALKQRYCGRHPDRPCKLWDAAALGDPSRNGTCFVLQPETYHVTDCETFSVRDLSASSHPRLPLTSLCLAPLPLLPSGRALSPAGLCRGAAPGQELSLCSAAHLP